MNFSPKKFFFKEFRIWYTVSITVLDSQLVKENLIVSNK